MNHLHTRLKFMSQLKKQPLKKHRKGKKAPTNPNLQSPKSLSRQLLVQTNKRCQFVTRLSRNHPETKVHLLEFKEKINLLWTSNSFKSFKSGFLSYKNNFSWRRRKPPGQRDTGKTSLIYLCRKVKSLFKKHGMITRFSWLGKGKQLRKQLKN